MKKVCYSLMLLLGFGFVPQIFAQTSLSEHLKPLEKFVGKTWRGEFVNSTPEKPIIDVSHWERALNGQAIRILHSLNNGEYGGESMIIWDKKTESLIFYYFTTAGFYTHGTIHIDGDVMTSHEFVEGSSEGITEVKATSEVLPDGRLKSKSYYLKNGEWINGHEIIYQEAPNAEVIFK